MSYLNRTLDPRRRTAAIGGVVAIHAVLAVGLLQGLDVDFERIVDTRIGATNIPLDPPPPPPPEPQPQQQTEQTFVTVPPSPLPSLVEDPVDIVTRDPVVEPTRFVVIPGPVVTPTVEPSVTPGFAPKRARPANNPQRWITTDDYPSRALRAEAEGTASYRLIVATSGRASACELTRSTGNGQLDQATCDFLLRRARFEAATDETGAKVVGAYTGVVKWEIPE